MTTNPKSLAEELAKECERRHNNNRLGVAETILQSIPLEELLECKQTLEAYYQSAAFRSSPDTAYDTNTMTKCRNTLAALNLKLKSILGEQK